MAERAAQRRSTTPDRGGLQAAAPVSAALAEGAAPGSVPGGPLVFGDETQKILLVLWAAGVLAAAVWFLYVNVRYYRRLNRGRRELASELLNQLGPEALRDSGMAVYVCVVSTPCLAGFWKKSIYLPPQVAADSAMLRYALLHEYCHYKHRDLFWSGVRCLMLAVFWYNPLMWLAAYLSRRDCELACDAAVVRFLGASERLDYGRALLELIRTQQGGPNLMCTATAMSDSVNRLRERVVRIALNRKMAAATLAAVITVVSFTSALTFTEAASGTEAVSAARQQELLQFGRQWASAYCNRDGWTLYDLSKGPDVFRQAGGYFLEEPYVDERAEILPEYPTQDEKAEVLPEYATKDGKDATKEENPSGLLDVKTNPPGKNTADASDRLIQSLARKPGGMYRRIVWTAAFCVHLVSCGAGQQPFDLASGICKAKGRNVSGNGCI